MKAPDNARGIEALEKLDKRAGVDDAAVGQRRQELIVQLLQAWTIVFLPTDTYIGLCLVNRRRAEQRETRHPHPESP